MSGFQIWSEDYISGNCVIKFPNGVSKAYQLSEGISRIADWNSEVFCQMDDEYPEDLNLADNLYGANLKVVSKRLKQFIQNQQIQNIEFLPIRIKNHQEENLPDEYFIVNPLGQIDCINLKKSNVEWNPLDENLIDSCDALILNKEKIPADIKIFRLKYLPNLIIVREDLAEKMKSQFTGIFFQNPMEYIGI